MASHQRVRGRTYAVLSLMQWGPASVRFPAALAADAEDSLGWRIQLVDATH